MGWGDRLVPVAESSGMVFMELFVVAPPRERLELTAIKLVKSRLLSLAIFFSSSIRRFSNFPYI